VLLTSPQTGRYSLAYVLRILLSSPPLTIYLTGTGKSGSFLAGAEFCGAQVVAEAPHDTAPRSDRQNAERILISGANVEAQHRRRRLSLESCCNYSCVAKKKAICDGRALT